jgi:hypothetical protein
MISVNLKDSVLVFVGFSILGLVYFIFQVGFIDIGISFFIIIFYMLVVIIISIKEFSIFNFGRIKPALLLYWAIGYYITPLYLFYKRENIINAQFLYSMIVASIGILSFILGNSLYFRTKNSHSGKDSVINLINNVSILYLTTLFVFVISTVIRLLFLNLGIYSSLFIGAIEDLPVSLTVYNALMPFLSINFLIVPIIGWLFFSGKMSRKQKFILFLIYFVEVIFSFISLQRFIVIYTLFTPIFVGMLLHKLRLKFTHYLIFFIFVLIFFYLNNVNRLYILASYGYQYAIQPKLGDIVNMLQNFWGYEKLPSNIIEIQDTFFYRFFDNSYKNLLAIIEKTEEFKLGSTYLLFIYNFIPRFLWPNKPVFQVSYDFGIEYGLINPMESVAIAVSRIGEAFMNFGIVGVIIILFIWGAIAKVIEQGLFKRVLWLYIYLFVNFVVIAETFFTNVIAIIIKQLIYFGLLFVLSLILLRHW